MEIGWFRCEACEAIKPLIQRAWRSSFDRGFGVCQTCYDAWLEVGHRCPRCWVSVDPKQILAFFPEAGRFGHYECGGALLV
jgi:hypothetical protein